METAPIIAIERPGLHDSDAGPALTPAPAVAEGPAKAERLVLRAFGLLIAYSVVYLFVLATRFEG